MMFWTLVGLETVGFSILIGLCVSRMKSCRAFRTFVLSRFQDLATSLQDLEMSLQGAGTRIRKDIKDIRKEIKDTRKEMSDDRKAVQERLIALEHPVST